MDVCKRCFWAGFYFAAGEVLVLYSLLRDNWLLVFVVAIATQAVIVAIKDRGG